jgi:hypothetical protein
MTCPFPIERIGIENIPDFLIERISRLSSLDIGMKLHLSPPERSFHILISIIKENQLVSLIKRSSQLKQDRGFNT